MGVNLPFVPSLSKGISMTYKYLYTLTSDIKTEGWVTAASRDEAIKKLVNILGPVDLSRLTLVENDE